mmetsp:Transcript_90254/g.200537  ORF Transcript_90254/g.200537 Transcript_90254/m.200537 type:complete len:667 (-) Transcript_90254:18-2018(-)
MRRHLEDLRTLDLVRHDDGNDDAVDGNRLAEDNAHQVLRADAGCLDACADDAGARQEDAPSCSHDGNAQGDGDAEVDEDGIARKGKRISFLDQVTGNSFEQYSKEKEHNVSHVLEQVKTGDGDAGTLVAPLKPMLTHELASASEPQSNVGEFTTCNMPQPGVCGEAGADEAGGIARTALGQSNNQTTLLGSGGQGGPVGVLTHCCAPAPGLHTLRHERGVGNEFVEVGKERLVISMGLLSEIPRAKLDQDRYHEALGAGCDSGGEIILPIVGRGRTAHASASGHSTDQISGNPGAAEDWGRAEEEQEEHKEQEFKQCKHTKSARRRSTSRASLTIASSFEFSSVPPPHLVAASSTAAQTPDPVGEQNELLVCFRGIQDASSCSSFHSTTPPDDGTGLDSPFWAGPGTGSQRGMDGRPGQCTTELVEPKQLASWLKDADLREGLLVLDVRGRDWVGGHIPSSVNLRTSEVVRHPGALLLQCRRHQVRHIVFTCMYSLLRARKCASALEKAQQAEQRVGLAPQWPLRISVLQGGMHAWINHFAGRSPEVSLPCEKAGSSASGVPGLLRPRKANPYIDGFDPECWCEGPSHGGRVHVMDALWSSGGQKALSDALAAELESLREKQGSESNTPPAAFSKTSSMRESDGEESLSSLTFHQACCTDIRAVPP